VQDKQDQTRWHKQDRTGWLRGPVQRKYHKIESVFKRDPENNFKTFLDGEWSIPEFRSLADAQWYATEKIDGTNCRIEVGENGYRIGGRTDNAQLHPEMVDVLQLFGNRAFHERLGGLTLFGEGCGPGIQKGGESYGYKKSFILFDVQVTSSGIFLTRSDVENIASKLNMRVVPRVWNGTLNEAVDTFKDMSDAVVAGKPLPEKDPLYSIIRSRRGDGFTKRSWLEGWVLKPTVELNTRLGARIITKIKIRDYPGMMYGE